MRNLCLPLIKQELYDAFVNEVAFAQTFLKVFKFAEILICVLCLFIESAANSAIVIIQVPQSFLHPRKYFRCHFHFLFLGSLAEIHIVKIQKPHEFLDRLRMIIHPKVYVSIVVPSITTFFFDYEKRC